MEKLKIAQNGLRKEVYDILTKSKKARVSDRHLYYELLKSRGISDVSIHEFTFGDSFPNYETVGRARRFIQQHYPELRPDTETNDKRYEKEVLFREHYGKEGLKDVII